MQSHDEGMTLNPIELFDTARSKYTLALARVRYGPPELALLSLHGSLEDALRAQAIRLHMPEAGAIFPELLQAMSLLEPAPLSSAEAEGIRRMHRLRARVAHGEQIAVTSETIHSYHRLVARLLPRYGVIVVGPEDEQALVRHEETRSPRRTEEGLRHHAEEGSTGRGTPAGLPRRERTVYPEAGQPRLSGRVMPSGATRDLPLAQEMLAVRSGRRGSEFERMDRMVTRWERIQGWLLPMLIGLSIFLVGAVISISLQMRSTPVIPTAVVASMVTTSGGPIVDPAAPGEAGTAIPEAVPAADGLAVGQTAYVRAETGPLNLRLQPGIAEEIPIQFILNPGTSVEIIGGPVEADGYSWWQVRSGGAEGWCAGQYLVR